MKLSFTKLLCRAGMIALAFGSGAGQAQMTGSKAISGTYVDVVQARKNLAAGLPLVANTRQIVSQSTTASAPQISSSEAQTSAAAGLPLWTFRFGSPRDGKHHVGAMVGSNPFTNPQSTAVPANIIPVVLHIHSAATAIDPLSGAITTVPGDFWVNPMAADHVCLKAPNNVPLILLHQSPIFQPTNFSFGGVAVGNTQYIDAFQRANFWNANSSVEGSYHVLLSPVNTLEPLVLDVPASEGMAMPSSLVQAFIGAPSSCGTLFYLDINWFDAIVNDQVLPALTQEGVVGPANLPIFFFYNTVTGNPIYGFFYCCVGGYHSSSGIPTPTQTYAVTDYDTTGLFSTAFADTAVISHELGEWVNDPFGINQVAAWGGTGQVSGCQGNLEVGDPLTGTTLAPLTMPNGYAYDLQELAFFSWFAGGRSIGVNGWYSNNGTFSSDAGTPCLLY